VAAGSLWTGCCGWAEARARYFAKFRTIELQSTFYEPLAAALAAKWRAEAPADFRFCIKAWQRITHEASSPTYRKAKHPLPEASRRCVGAFRPTEEVWRAWETTREIARVLHAAVILFQCPPSFQPTGENISNLITFFQQIQGCRHALAWEPRGNWPLHTVRELCERLGLIHCVDPFSAEPATHGVWYLRLHGRGGYRYRYTSAELQDLYARVAERGHESYVLFNNLWMLEDAERFAALSGGDA